MKDQFAGAEWLKKAYPKKEVSPLGLKVADILGFVFKGLYHLGNLPKIEWADPYSIVVPLRRSLSTYDFSDLSQLVIVCHDECVRLEISAHTFQHLKLMFHQRQREGGINERHPTIEKQIEAVRSYTKPQSQGAELV